MLATLPIIAVWYSEMVDGFTFKYADESVHYVDAKEIKELDAQEQFAAEYAKLKPGRWVTV